jgi:hypothetical protein
MTVAQVIEGLLLLECDFEDGKGSTFHKTLASLCSSSHCTGLKHPKPTVLGPAIIVVIAAVFIINLITIISLNSP